MPAPPIVVDNAKSDQATDGKDLLVAEANGAAWFRFDGTTWSEGPFPASGAIIDKHQYYVTYIAPLNIIVTMGTRASIHEMWIIKTHSD